MEQPLGWDKSPAWVGFLWRWQENGALGERSTLGWHPAPIGEGGDLPFAPLLPSSPKGKEQKRDVNLERGEAERSKAQAMESDNLNSCAEGLSLQAN